MLGSIKTQLTILQQEGYEIGRFLSWWVRHPLKFSVSSKKPLVHTAKVKTILKLTSILFLTFSIITYFKLGILSLVSLIFILGLMPWILFVTAILLIKPYEIWNKKRTVESARSFFQSRKDIAVVGITGSFGKTSLKDFLFEIVNDPSHVVKTPDSYNTVFGIKKVLEFEITKKTKTFICEMGAYFRGEIAELCYMNKPQYAVLTAIGSQHLERFGSLENTTLAKFELIDAVEPSKALVNLDNERVKNKIKEARYREVLTYSINDKSADFYLSNYTVKGKNTVFSLTHKGKKISFETSLFGTSNLSNLVGAIGMAIMMGTPREQIIGRVKKIEPTPHRLELKKINKATLIDNAFSSNEQGFESVLKDLEKLKGKKVLFTPGVIELGEATVRVHKQLGQKAENIFDLIYLVGKSERTQAFEEGLGGRAKVIYLENNVNLWPEIKKVSLTHDWILLENDLPDTF